MKTRMKAVLGGGILLALICAAALLLVRRSYCPMGGEAAVVDKAYFDSAYHITIQHGRAGGQYTLVCSREQFEAVSAGEMIDCDRYQSVITRRGIVTALRGRDSGWINITEEDWKRFDNRIIW